MTEVDDTTDRRPTWMPRVAWGLTLTWAAFATYYLLFGRQARMFTTDELVCCFGPFLLPVFATVVILLRFEAVGGVMLILQGLFGIVAIREEGSWVARPPVEELMALASGLLPLIAGPLFLVSWWKSRTAVKEERERVASTRTWKERDRVASTRTWKDRTQPELPLTASGLLYLFGEEFANPRGGRLSGSQTRLVRSGQKVGSVSLAHSLFLAAFVSLAEDGYISLRLQRIRGRLGVYRERVTVTKESGGEALPPSLERAIMDSISGDSSEDRVKAVVLATVSGGTKAEAVKWTVGSVMNALGEAGYLDWVLEPGFVAYEVHWWAETEAVAPLAQEVETVKNTLRAFQNANALLYKRLSQEISAGFDHWQWMIGLLEGLLD